MLSRASGLLIPTLQEGSDFEKDLLHPYFLGERLTREELESCMSIGLRLMVHDGTKLELDVPAHSIVQLWPQALSSHMGFSSDNGHQQLLDVNGALKTTDAVGTNGTMEYRCDGGVNITTKGIVCGTDATAVAQTDYSLVTLIAAGNGAGQLAHATTGFAAVSSSGTSRLITITRAFTNNSGGVINVAEVALYCTIQDSANNVNTHMLCRDILSFSVGIGQTKTVTYVLTVALT